MPIYTGLSQVNRKEIIINGKQMQKVYVGDKLVWQKPSAFTAVKYGLLYNWYAATDVRKITSSDDWVVPTSTQQTTLAVAAGDSASGIALKESGTVWWASNNGTNIYSFNGRGTGHRIAGFDSLRSEAEHWASNQYNTTMAWNRILQNSTASYFQQAYSKYYGLGVRLLYVGSGIPTSYTGSDGKVYGVVRIGSQYWINCNLAETKYRNGDLIPEVTDNTTWAGLSSGAMCAYNNDWSNV